MHKIGTWGAFFEHLAACGVRRETRVLPLPDGTEGPVEILVSGCQCREITYVLPADVADDRPCRFRRRENVCRRLGIPQPKDWPVEL